MIRPLATALSCCLIFLSCGGPGQPSGQKATSDSLTRDSLAELDMLLSQLDGWEAQMLEGLNAFKVTCRLQTDSLAFTAPAVLEDSTLILLRYSAAYLTDSLRSDLIYQAASADESQLETLQLLQSLVADSKTAEDFKNALMLFCEWASVEQDITPIIQ